MHGLAGDGLTTLAAAGCIAAACGLTAGILQRQALALVYPLCLVASLLALAAHLSVLAGLEVHVARLPLALPEIGLRLRLDPLAAFFGVIVNIGLAAACLYGLSLDRRTELSPRVEPFLPFFAIAMNAVLVADDAFTFLFAWELMSLASWALVVSRHTDPAARHAGHVYLVMAAFGTAALLFAFGGMAGAAGGYAFDAIRGQQMAPVTAGLVLAATIVGAGSKAGVMPLHAWLPLAHPAAPSHVSALMSGVMTKVAIYGIVRIVFDLMGAHQQWWWAVPFILLGAGTAVLGLLHAVLDTDLKRILAYSTIENVGIILVGLGMAIAFKSADLHTAAAIAMAAALLHALNHSWFKSLLFLGAGAVLHSTGRRDLDGLGGLIHRMPRTAVFFLVGAFAIAAMPPLNGFVSEWLLFQAVLAGHALQQPLLRFLIPALGAMLALAAALAAACFVRAYGATFLGRPRSPEAAGAHEAPFAAMLAMGLLAGLCLAGGLLGNHLLGTIAPVLDMTVGARVPAGVAGPTPFSMIPFDLARSVYDAPIIAMFVLVSTTLTIALVHRLSSRRTRRAPPWDCGYPDASPMTQYSASSFAQPLRRVYGAAVLGATESVDMPAPGDMRAARLEVRLTDHIWEWLYAAPAAALLALSKRLNAIQYLTIRRYLVFMFVALIALLLLVVGLE